MSLDLHTLIHTHTHSYTLIRTSLIHFHTGASQWCPDVSSVEVSVLASPCCTAGQIALIYFPRMWQEHHEGGSVNWWASLPPHHSLIRASGENYKQTGAGTRTFSTFNGNLLQKTHILGYCKQKFLCNHWFQNYWHPIINITQSLPWREYQHWATSCNNIGLSLDV